MHYLTLKDIFKNTQEDAFAKLNPVKRYQPEALQSPGGAGQFHCMSHPQYSGAQNDPSLTG